MYSHNAPDVLWVSSRAEGKGKGTHASPFAGVQEAVERAKPGDTVVLADGMYDGDVTIQTSGTISKPIRIVGEHKDRVIVSRSCWYFYDITDLIVSDLTFRDAPNGAVFVMGQCQRNAFSHMNFVNCSTAPEAACTFFFGGSGGRDNVVEQCSFLGVPGRERRNQGDMALPVGLMISEGDDEELSAPNRDHLFRENSFVNYGCGILIGSRGVEGSLYGHVVERNTIRDITGDGIRVRCGDTSILNNHIERCGATGVVVLSGSSSTVELNRIEHCATGIRAFGDGHTITDNCILDCREQAMHIPVANEAEQRASENVMIENNTCVACGDDEGTAAGFTIARESTCIVRRNIVFGPGEPHVAEKKADAGLEPVSSFFDDNVAGGGCESGDGFRAADVHFSAAESRNYATESDYGARGWSARGGIMEPEDAPDTEFAADVSDPESAEQLLKNLNRRQLMPDGMFGISEDLGLRTETEVSPEEYDEGNAYREDEERE